MRTRCTFQVRSLREDPFLDPFRAHLESRKAHADAWERRLTEGERSLADFASGHEFFGLHRRSDAWIFREWAPNAQAVFLIGPFSDWDAREPFALNRREHGVWELTLAEDILHHGDPYRLRVRWDGGEGDRIPSYARRVVQDADTGIFNAQVWRPDDPYRWQHPAPPRPPFPLIYEAHVGMAQDRAGIGTYDEFRRNVLPRIRDAGYNTVQLMAVAEHPYYASFGYHVSSFFAASSRFGTPDELKTLIDEAHGMGLTVLMDLIHSHAVSNEVEGLARFDGTRYQYFHHGARGGHPAWGSLCFDYGKPEVLHFLLSNCRFWMDEYRVDGFRFDGVTSMLYRHHGLGPVFSSYTDYFDESVDKDALSYLTLANSVVHGVRPDATTVAEDVSGLPGLGAPRREGGVDFDYRLAMGVPDCVFKLVREVRDEDWSLGWLWQEITNRRADERTVSYVESHDQAIVGSKTLIFELADAAMYEHMHAADPDPVIDRALALHKMIRLCVLAASGHGYLNFMGNEFGHPEWIDFPREGNNWSYHYSRRQWHLVDDPELKYRFLAAFDRAALETVKSEGCLCRDVRLVARREDDKVLAMERGGVLFVFNFHPTRSLSDYFIETPARAGKLVMDSDRTAFGGHGRVQSDQTYPLCREDDRDLVRWGVRLYLPCRTALVLRMIDGEKNAGNMSAPGADGDIGNTGKKST